MKEVIFTDRFSLEVDEDVRENSLKKRFGAFGIAVDFKIGVISFSTEKPIALDEWREIINKNLK
mgnify:CR=1 FL=1